MLKKFIRSKLRVLQVLARLCNAGVFWRYVCYNTCQRICSFSLGQNMHLESLLVDFRFLNCILR